MMDVLASAAEYALILVVLLTIAAVTGYHQFDRILDLLLSLEDQ